MRSLVILSLDGFSQTLFNSFRFSIPVINELMQHSLVFRNFHSASTSGFQSFCDLMYGDSSELDHNEIYPSGPGCLRGRNSHFFALLRAAGYETLGAQLGTPCPAYAREGFWGAWPEECGPFLAASDSESIHAAIQDIMERAAANRKPFAMYLSLRSFMPRDGTVVPGTTPGYHWINMFNQPDRGLMVKQGCAPWLCYEPFASRLLAALSGRGALAGTLLAVLANHGLDFWTHRLYGGRTHAIDPYADLCWLPLFIYNNGADAGVYDNIVSMVDLKTTLFSMLMPDASPPPPQTPFAGMNVFREKRSFAFSQRMFARQFDNRDEYKSMEKSYSITDGDQRLIVSSGGGKENQGGMELYYDVRDPSNTRNFLDFFKLDAAGNMTEFGHKHVNHVHFLQAFKPHLVMSVVGAYNAMRQHLYNFVRAKEMAAILDPQNPRGEVMPDKVFTRKREQPTGRRL